MAEASRATTQATAGEAPAPEVPTDAEWYVVNTYSGYEAKVKQNMEQRVRSMEARDKVFRIVVPEEDVEESRHGQRRTVKRKMYPGYVLVQMLSLDEVKNARDPKAKQDADDAWQVVRNTPGVVNFVGADAGSGHKPIPLSPEEAGTIFRQMEGEGQRPEVRIQIGERVKIIDGPFTDFFGTVDEVMEDKERLRVLVSFFGRDTPVELDFLQVEKSGGGSII
ncbi:MAG: transcription termination/antitermination protein NusG [Chloroflexi bacterium]|nr:transcription termination/antitermination protein NusG [Chloroflexota bacterium]